MCAIRGEISPSEVELKLDDPETTIFIAELSFCLTSKWPDVAKNMLHDHDIRNIEAFYSYQAGQEAAFQMMLMWLRSSVGPRMTLQCLTDALKRNGIEIRVHNLKMSECMHSCEKEHFHQLSRSTVAEISNRIASQWKFIGRFLGMSESDIGLLAASQGPGVEGHYKLMEQTVAMLDMWGRINGYQATMFKLRNVIFAVHEHSGHVLRDAVDFLTMPFQ